jgi:diphthine methyl ester synthase
MRTLRLTPALTARHQMKEPDPEEMLRGRIRYLPPRFMTINTAVEQLLEAEAKLKQGVLR